MYSEMLVLLDGSRLAEVVLPYAGELAVRLGLRVTLLHVCSVQECESVPMHRDYIQRAAEIARHQWAGGEKTPRPGSRPLEPRAELTVGHPAEEILRYAGEKGIDLIVMATHGRSGIRRWALGSVADKVLSASDIPILLVRAGVSERAGLGTGPGRTILVPLDGSELSESILPHVGDLAKQCGAELLNVILLGVCEPVTAESSRAAGSQAGQEDHMARCKEESSQYLGRVEKRLRDSGLNVGSRVLEGVAADEIVGYANSNPPSLIAMVTHGRSGRSRWIYGSVAEKVLLGASSPVLLVRPGQPGPG